LVGGRSIRTYDSTVVRTKTDSDLVGHGKVCPLGSAYLPAYGAGACAGLAELAPHLIDQDPTEFGAIHRADGLPSQGAPLRKIRN
jgi:hypothetical protein